MKLSNSRSKSQLEKVKLYFTLVTKIRTAFHFLFWKIIKFVAVETSTSEGSSELCRFQMFPYQTLGRKEDISLVSRLVKVVLIWTCFSLPSCSTHLGYIENGKQSKVNQQNVFTSTRCIYLPIFTKIRPRLFYSFLFVCLIYSLSMKLNCIKRWWYIYTRHFPRILALLIWLN